MPSPGGPGPITATDEFVWFAEPNDDAIGRISLTGEVTEYPLTTQYQEPRGIKSGSRPGLRCDHREQAPRPSTRGAPGDREGFNFPDPVPAPPVACALLYRKVLDAVLAPVLPRPPSPRSRKSPTG